MHSLCGHIWDIKEAFRNTQVKGLILLNKYIRKILKKKHFRATTNTSTKVFHAVWFLQGVLSSAWLQLDNLKETGS